METVIIDYVDFNKKSSMELHFTKPEMNDLETILWFFMIAYSAHPQSATVPASYSL